MDASSGLSSMRVAERDHVEHVAISFRQDLQRLQGGTGVAVQMLGEVEAGTGWLGWAGNLRRLFWSTRLIGQQ